MAAINKKRPNKVFLMSWQTCLLWSGFFCVTINVYFTIIFQERLNHLSSKQSLPLQSRIAELSGDGSLEPKRRNEIASDPTSHSQFSEFYFDREIAEEALSVHGSSAIFQPLRAFVEKPLNDTVPGTIDSGNLNEKRPKIEVGRPAKFYVPLPLRNGSPDDLKMFEYGHRVRSCRDLPSGLPVDRGLGKHVVTNVNNRLTFASGALDIWEEAKVGCPVNADAFLPWVHDVFPDATGAVIHFIAQNKRRCNSGKIHWEDIVSLQPQATILQPVSVRRIDESTAQKLAPELWTPDESDNRSRVAHARYRLAPHEEADIDGMFTRFICRFRAIDYSLSPPSLVNIGESLSTYPYNYEYVNYRKDIGDLSMLTPKGKDNPMFWLAQLRFDCPVPDNGDLRSVIASGESVLSDGTPSVYVDVVPIRTAPRYGKRMSYFTPDMAGTSLDITDDKFNYSNLMKDNIVQVGDGTRSITDENHPPRAMKNGFDPRLFWGDRHVLPRIEASGRWENFPVCTHPGFDYQTAPKKRDEKIFPARADAANHNSSASSPSQKKKHKLTACLWASASFTTRGNAQSVSDTTMRLIEWIEFHLLVGFDHFYIYDNTGAHTNETSLEPTLFPRFLDSEVTRIDWPSRVCNNNIPAHENTGERSSQYAAENSCRARYGPYTEWMVSFDTDEYLIPMGKYNSMAEVVDDAAHEGRQILTFRSTRSSPIYSYMEPFHDHKDCGTESDPNCLRVRPGSLFAEAYNCDFDKTPKPSWADRAKKQLYRPEYVLTHYVHYATVTQGILQTKEDARKKNQPWQRQFHESRSADRTTDEINQAVMLHSKTTVPEYTADWKQRCKFGAAPSHGQNCRIGFPWPRNDENDPVKANPDGFGYNCFTNERLNEVWIPKLRLAMASREARLRSLQGH